VLPVATAQLVDGPLRTLTGLIEEGGLDLRNTSLETPLGIPRLLDGRANRGLPLTIRSGNQFLGAFFRLQQTQQYIFRHIPTPVLRQAPLCACQTTVNPAWIK